MKIYLSIFFSLLISHSMAQGKFFGGNGDGFAVSETAIALPVDLVSFEATLLESRAHISWTAIAQNISSFTLEVSNDGSRFDYLTEKTVTENAIVPAKYGYADVSRAGLWYYRLKWKEADGSTRYSKIIAVQFPAITKMTVYYDLEGDYVQISKPAAVQHIELYSADGRLQTKMRSNLFNCRLSVNGLPAGIYFIRALDDISGKVFTERFVKRAY
jgi:hypothetical protein